ncbi:hypothetical protein [Guggenheimella bovis]
MKIQTNAQTIAEIKKVIEENPGEGSMVRLFVAGVGCSGPSFGLALDERNEGDEYYEEDGLGFLMEKAVYDQMGDAIVEFSDGGYLVYPVNQPEGGCSSCSGCH